MLAYTVHEPPEPATDRLDRAESLVFVKDGFNWFAALLTPVWMLVNRLWWPLAAYIVVVSLLTVIFEQLGVPQGWQALAMLSLSGVIGFEADSIRRWSLEQKGWSFVGTVVGRNAAECERRFFETWLPRQPVLRVPGGGPEFPVPQHATDHGARRQAVTHDRLDVQVDLNENNAGMEQKASSKDRSGFWTRFGAWFSRRRPAGQS